MEQPSPGNGGRHRETFTYGTQADAAMTPRDVLAAGARDLRSVNQDHDLYGPYVRDQIREVINLNKTAHPGIFAK